MGDNVDILAYLASKGLNGKRGASGEYVFPCFMDCDEPADSRKRKLYINADTGYYHCKVCEAKGGTTLLQRHFGDEPEGDAEVARIAPNRKFVLDRAAGVAAQMLGNNDELMLYLLNERGLSPETIVERQLGFVGNGWSLVRSLEGVEQSDLEGTGLVHRDGHRAGQDFFYDHLMIPYIEDGRCVQMRGRSLAAASAGRYMTGPGEQVRLFNADALDGATDVIITEGEFDCMVLAQHLSTAADDRVRKMAVVAIPGCSALPGGEQGFKARFADARRVYIALDPDDPGRRAAVKIKDLLGAKARIVELPDDTPEKCDWSYFFTEHGGTWRDAMALIGEASGKRIVTVAEAAARWQKHKDTTGGLRTGYVQFDETILPGMLPGQLMVVLAKTGTGKTIFLVNVAFNMRDVPTLFISLEMTAEEVYERLRRVYLHHRPRASDDEIHDAYSQLQICDANKLGPGEIASLIDEYELETGVRPHAVFVDYLGYYARGQGGSGPYERTSNAVMELKGEAKASRVVIISPHQVNRVAKEGKPIEGDDARDSGVVEETADFLLSLWKPDDAIQVDQAQPTGKIKLSVLKSRHGGKGRTFTLMMDHLTLALVDDGTPAAREAANHNYLYWRGVSYDDLRWNQTKPEQVVLG